ncbi:flagellar hook capping FlgD N-terminal domain-containing protein [Yoonia sp. R2331]|uniref:flagellar hook capping FlgD N-terminal domain-containing protein n=1 Tax=Yoonia sp. R2331 TaxID=3237238 RepID=UPI0034E56730
MEVSNATNPTATPPPSVSSRPEISSDFETFLKMLTVQMQNQDPLNPVDSSDYAVQLATFSGVEQQVQTNDLLRDLATKMGGGDMAQISGWVGMEVRSTAPVNFDGSPLQLLTSPDASAANAALVVKDADGNEIQRLQMSTSDREVTWAGVTADGAPLPPGRYSFEVVSSTQGEEISRTGAETYARVNEVQLRDGQVVVVLASGATVAASDVTAVRESSDG